MEATPTTRIRAFAADAQTEKTLKEVIAEKK